MEKAVLLIDAENFSHRHVKKLFEELNTDNLKISLKVAFADWSQNSLNTDKWKLTLNKLAIRSEHLFNFSNGKNASDIQLVIYATKLIYEKPDIDTFIIATSDGDFTPLVLTLKEYGKKVIGFGSAVSSQVLNDSCDEYHIIHLQNEKVINQKPSNNKKQQFDHKKLRNILLSIWQQCFHDQFGWVHFDYISKVSKKAYPSFNFKDYGYETIKEMIEDCDLFEMEKINGKNHIDHYFKPRESLDKELIEIFDNTYFSHLKEYVDNNWLLISELNATEINISEYGYSSFEESLKSSNLYEVRNIENEIYYRRRMTKDQRHIAMLFLNAWHDYRFQEKITARSGIDSYLSLNILQEYIRNNLEEEFSAKKYNLTSLTKTVCALFPLKVKIEENETNKDFLIKPKYF